MAQTKKMNVRYIGPYSEGVEVLIRNYPLPDSYVHVDQGEVYTTTLDHAQSLLEQDVNWEAADDKPKKRGDQ